MQTTFYKIMNIKLVKLKVINTILDNLNENLDYETSFEKACDDLKLTKEKKNILFEEFFAEGFHSLINHTNIIINQEMKKAVPRDFSDYRINEKIRFFIFLRIEIINKLFDRKKLIKLALKQKSLIKLVKMLFNVSDEIWYLSGDKSTDFNYYSKRIILMNVYTTSFLFNLKDNSKNFIKTKDLIDKQIDYVLRFGRIKSRLKNLFYSKTT